MALKNDHIDVGHRHAPPEHTPRLRLKPKAPQSGYVDGAWWPHSEDLTAERPDLRWRPESGVNRAGAGSGFGG
jgi:Family of unknown function (DUF5994)